MFLLEEQVRMEKPFEGITTLEETWGAAQGNHQKPTHQICEASRKGCKWPTILEMDGAEVTEAHVG